MKIETTRFGTMDIDDQAIISVPGGLIGFPDQERYILIRHQPESPFFWFQAIHRADLAFVIVDPLLFKSDYAVPLPQMVLTSLQAQHANELSIYVIVTIPQGQPETMTANLLGPLVINTRTRLARQLVLDEKHYSHRHPLLSAKDRKKNQAQNHHRP